MEEVKTAACAVMFWQDGKLVWDDYLRQRQFALTGQSERVVRWFCEWRDLESARLLGERALEIAGRLLETGVLIRRDSPEDLAERELLAEWGAFGPATRYLHFGARTTAEARYVDLADDEAYFTRKARTDPPPPVAKTYPDRPLVGLPEGRVTGADWPRPGLVEALYGRRSTRSFTAEPVSLEAVGEILRLAGGVVEELWHPELGPVLFRSGPSAGARHPLELYLYADRVEGLEAGLYHFSPTRGGLEPVGPAVPYDVRLAATGGQHWLADGAAMIVHTAVLARTRWRYAGRRAYRDVLIELGHLSQTVLLAATALGLGSVFGTAVRDEELERLLGLTGSGEPVLGVTAIGHASAPEDAGP
ncbi:SagB/ThcOx family dehydrogenase [Planobispora siamensis]|uniref:Nitroreductase domain-containing protein n=1 Tax=Planobispora siamensis TaxID=936338 RepID=A0A8J3WLP7_9ACTN|nr:SagB/ThcOx family dehydrogenase [Planobispora siamensis]GIH92747.1 hypothetical protein Psi01_33770 [Planobispora siamensis]